MTEVARPTDQMAVTEDQVAKANSNNGWLILHQIRPWLSDYAAMMGDFATNPALPLSLRSMAKVRQNEVIDLVRKIP